MLNVGRIRTVGCRGVTRRRLMHVGALAPLGLSLADLLRLESLAAGPAPAAKSVILLWLWGGPPHLDTFDLKPKAPVEYRGPYRPVATSAHGVEICELLPQLARRADKYALIRS